MTSDNDYSIPISIEDRFISIISIFVYISLIIFIFILWAYLPQVNFVSAAVSCFVLSLLILYTWMDAF
jgi:hypothetical protein